MKNIGGTEDELRKSDSPIPIFVHAHENLFELIQITILHLRCHIHKDRLLNAEGKASGQKWKIIKKQNS